MEGLLLGRPPLPDDTGAGQDCEAAGRGVSEDLPGQAWGIKRLSRGFPCPLLTNAGAFAIVCAAPHRFQPGARENVMAKGQMRSNKEKKKPKADKNLKKGGAAPSPFASGKPPAGQSPNSKKN
jgi:hypothetical protein